MYRTITPLYLKKPQQYQPHQRLQSLKHKYNYELYVKLNSMSTFIFDQFLLPTGSPIGELKQNPFYAIFTLQYSI